MGVRTKLATLILMGAGVGVMAAPLADFRGGQIGRIEFKSTTPDHRHALIHGRLGSPLVIYGDLLMPTNRVEGKVPVVVFSHGSEGAAPRYYDFWAKELNRNGFAVFVVNSFKPRTIGVTTGAAQLTFNITGNISDSVHALKLLATHPKIDSSRIFHMGWSLGGAVAQDAAFPSYSRPILGTSDAKWAGSIALYGGCNIVRRVDHNAPNPGPLLMMLAELDDNTPAANCVTYAMKLAASGSNVAFKVYEGAYHDWDTDFDHRVNHGIFSDCDIEIKLTPGASYGAGFDFRAGKAILNGSDEGVAIRSCQKMSSVIVRGNRKIRDQSLKDVLEFLRQPSVDSAAVATPAAAEGRQAVDKRTEELLREMAPGGSKK